MAQICQADAGQNLGTHKNFMDFTHKFLPFLWTLRKFTDGWQPCALQSSQLINEHNLYTIM